MSRVLIIVTSSNAGKIYSTFNENYHPVTGGVLTVTEPENTIVVIDRVNNANLTGLTKSTVNRFIGNDIVVCSHVGYIENNNLTFNVIEYRHNGSEGKKLLEFAQKKMSFENIWEYLKKERYNCIVADFLHSLLPLDIDLQALAKLPEKKKPEEPTKARQEYLSEMYRDDINYIEKFNKFRTIKQSIVISINNERVEELSGESVRQFFEKLTHKKPCDELFSHGWNIDGITSFHSWYCATASCLRGEDVGR